MAIRTYKVTLDSKNTIAPEPIFLRQGDKTGAVIIDASVTDNGSAFNLDGLTPVFKANTADNEAVIIDSTGFSIVDASNGEFTYKVPGALSTAPGKIRTAYFGFTDHSGVESTFNLTFVVQAAPDVGTVKSENYITVINGTYANIAELKAAYPQGNPGIFVTTNDQNWCYWDDKKGAWIAGGPFNAQPVTDDQKDVIRQYILDSDNLIKNGDFFNGDMSALKHNAGTSLSFTTNDSLNWAHVTGNVNQGNTDAYFNVPVSGDTTWIQWSQLKFDCDILPSKNSNLRVFIDIIFTAGISRTVLINQFTVQTNQHNRISVLTPKIDSLNPDGKTVTSINIGIASLDDDVDYAIAKARIDQYRQPINGENLVKNYEANQKDNLVTDSQLITNLPNLQATNGTVSLVQLNGRNWNQVITVDKTKATDAYYSVVDKRFLNNFVNRKWVFKGTLLCATDSDYMLYCDTVDPAGGFHRITIGSVHVYANKEKSFAVETPTLAESTAFNVTDVITVNFTITPQDPNAVTNVTDIYIKPFAPTENKTTLEYFEKDAIDKYGTSLVGHDGSVKTIIDKFSKLSWINSIPTPPSNNEIYLRMPKPNNIKSFAGYDISSIRLGLAILSGVSQKFTLRLDIVDNTGKITSKDLGVYSVISNQRYDVKVDTPIINQVYMSDPATIAEIRFVISPENKVANYSTGNYSITFHDNDTPKIDTMFSPNYIPYNLGNAFNNNAGTTTTDILESNIRKLSIKGIAGQTNTNPWSTDVHAEPTVLPEYSEKRWQEHLVFEPAISCIVTTQLDFFKDNTAVQTIVLGKHNVLAGQKLLLNDVSPKLSDVVSVPYTRIIFNIKTDMPQDTLAYKISDFYIKEYIPEALSSPAQSTSGANKLPELQLYGQLPQTATDKTTVNFNFVSGSLKNDGYTTLAWQGQSSQSLAKKSYKLKTYTTSDLSKKLKMQIDPTFASASAFTLKAFYSDKTLSLDNVANEVIHDMVISRKTVSEHLSKSDYFGQCKGRPVMLYVNDIFAGLYFMRSGSKDDMYFMDENDPNQFVIEGETEGGAAMFQAPHVTLWGDGSDADLNKEFAPNIPDKLTDAQKKAFDDFVNMVYTGDLTTFKNSLTTEALQSAIDYIIFYNLFGNVDSCGRNLEWATWDGGQHFMVIPYDFDQTMFNAWDGLSVGDATADGFPVKQMRFGTTTNKYFDLIAQAYPDEIKARYAELRSDLLREDNVLSKYTNFMKQIDIENYAKEMEQWPRKTVIDYPYISNFINTRFKLVDQQIKTHLG